MSDPSPFLPDDNAHVDEKPAWGFRITLVLLAIYLAYRFVEMGIWLVHWLTGG